MAYQSGKEIHLNQNNQGLHYSRVEEDQLPETLPTQWNSRRTRHRPQLCICIQSPINIITGQLIPTRIIVNASKLHYIQKKRKVTYTQFQV